MARDGEVRRCACGDPFRLTRSTQRWCKPWCHARQDHLRILSRDYNREQARAAAAPIIAPVRTDCASGDHPLDPEAIVTADTVCTVCRRKERYAAGKRERLASQLAAESKRVPRPSLGVVTIGRDEFDIIWNGTGTLPGAEWSELG